MITALGEPDADVIAAVVRACRDVADLSAGRTGDVVTYLPGQRVHGVRIDETVVTVHVVGRFGPSIAQIAAEVVAAVAPYAPARRVDVVVDDLADPDAPTPNAGDPAEPVPL